jgi:hypothetical protein
LVTSCGMTPGCSQEGQQLGADLNSSARTRSNAKGQCGSIARGCMPPATTGPAVPAFRWRPRSARRGLPLQPKAAAKSHLREVSTCDRVMCRPRLTDHETASGLSQALSPDRATDRNGKRSEFCARRIHSPKLATGSWTSMRPIPGRLIWLRERVSACHLCGEGYSGLLGAIPWPRDRNRRRTVHRSSHVGRCELRRSGGSAASA